MMLLGQTCSHTLLELIGKFFNYTLTILTRLKYYKAPLVPTIQERDPNEAQISQELQPMEQEEEELMEEEPAAKEVGCQSKYRESEA